MVFEKGKFVDIIMLQSTNWSTKVEHSNLYFPYAVFLVNECVFCIQFTSLIYGTLNEGREQ
jgi:hypothetical protein